MSITATQPESIGDPLWCVSWKSELSVASVCFTYKAVPGMPVPRFPLLTNFGNSAIEFSMAALDNKQPFGFLIFYIWFVRKRTAASGVRVRHKKAHSVSCGLS